MITLNEIKVNEVVYLNGKIGQKSYSVELTEEIKKELIALTAEYNACTTAKKAQKVLDKATKLVNDAKTADSSSLVDVLKGDLMLNKKTGKYHVISDGKTAKKPVHQFIVDKMIEANDKGLSPKPWLIFWVRLMRNKLFASNDAKVDNFMNYMKATYVDKEHAKELEEEGYSENMAKELATHDQISITEQGILAAFKYVRLLDTKFEVVKNKETGEQEIKEVPRYEKSELQVDENTGEVIQEAKDVLPEAAEEFVFEPPVMGKGGNAFTSRDIDDASDEPKTSHIIQVGKIHELPKGFEQVNCNDSQSGVKGLHLGGYYYVQGFGGKTSYLVDCLVSPEDVGAVCDVTSNWEGEGAIRCKRYMVTGGHFAVSKGMYHPSAYAALMDTEWETIKGEAIANLKKAIAEVEEQL